ncbi:glucosamine-6-phosphate deaminase [Sulfobacillus harzensis]|uniref:Glucosamine-6-phosphate deaminase n=1 Tax=Sulfobacillus harzensis TaxID=2729629 RepID=A0A7Y0L4R4_9FIRM|nr:glucosamine-6-phosphate deaminase [Sulfobacillus harzensis]NMP22942.1 glucosamine-6-phosphate deaminase [Sulfobacillus harzensis]
MKVRRFSSDSLATVYTAALIESLLQREPHPVLGLATGATPVNLYRQLVDFHRQGLSFSHVTTINLDEYVGLPWTHPQSYHRFMQDHLFSQIDIPPGRTFIPDGTADDLEAECVRYDAILAAHPIDLQILGIGRNGHIGFNEPDISLKTRTHVIQLTEDTMQANARFFGSGEQVPDQAITMGIQSILQAKAIVLMAFGRDKAWAVKRALSGEVSTEVPASFLQMHPNVTFVLDEEAAADL